MAQAAGGCLECGLQNHDTVNRVVGFLVNGVGGATVVRRPQRDRFSPWDWTALKAHA